MSGIWFNPLTLFQLSRLFVRTLSLLSCANPLAVVSTLPILGYFLVLILSPVDKPWLSEDVWRGQNPCVKEYRMKGFRLRQYIFRERRESINAKKTFNHERVGTRINNETLALDIVEVRW